MGSLDETSKYDAIVIGAGFGGYTMLPKYVRQQQMLADGTCRIHTDRDNRLRQLGLRAKIFERGSGSGGVW